MLRRNPYTQVPLALVLPSIAATHFEVRDGADGSLEALAEVERFARTRYLVHLASGVTTDPEINETLVRYTGLPIDVIRRRHGRVSVRTYAREFEKRNDRVLSHYDGTVSAAVPRNSGIQFDPILEGAVMVLEPAFTRYARSELAFKTDLLYRLLNREVSGQWDFGTSANRQGFAGALDELQSARTHNPALGVLIVHGYTDLVTPYAVSRYLVDQVAPIAGARPVELKTYRGGHMMYLRAPSRHALSEDARALYRQLLPPP
jgi:carboxypeptidase C (cathepsin A)